MKIKFYENTWKLIVHVDLSNLESKFNLIESTIQKTQDICQYDKAANSSLCNTSLKLLEQSLPVIKSKFESFNDLIGHNRQKRGIIDGIGTIFKLVFGTLDHNDAEYYDKVINSLEKDDKAQFKLLEEQTHVVKSTISNFNSTLIDLKENTKLFNSNLHIFEMVAKQINTRLFDIEWKQQTDEHMSLLTLITNEFEKQLSDLITAILVAKTNVLHPVIITPRQLISELQKTLPYLPPSTNYAASLEIKNFYLLVQLMQINAYRFNSRLIFIIHSPLVNNENYNLYNLIPLPIKTNENSHIYILPKINYLALSENKLQYTLITSFSNCKKINEIRSICQLDSPIFSTHVKPICESELLLNNDYIPKNCDTRISNIDNEIWHRLHNSNNWIYVTSKPVSLTINCKGQSPLDIPIVKTGILSLAQSCKGYTSTTVLTSYSTIKESTHLSILPNFDIRTDDCCKNFKKENLSIPQMQEVRTNLNLDNLRVASYKLDEIARISKQLNDQPSMINKFLNNNYFSYIFCIIIKLIALYLLYKIFILIKNRWFRTRRTNYCSNIRNCLTFNCFKNKIQPNVSLELNENTKSNSEEVDEEQQTLRRSLRIAQLKESF